MKLFTKSFAVICLLTTIMNGYSQAYSYVPMPDSAAQWNCLYTFTNGSNVTSTENQQFSLHGDTLIKGIHYNQVYETYDNTEHQNYGYAFAMREDSFKRIFVIGHFNTGGYTPSPSDTTYPGSYLDTIEYLLYDFSMEVGQSFYDTLLNYKPAVVSIDTISFAGSLRKRFYIVDTISSYPLTTSSDYWIEGMGSTRYGLINSFGYCFESCSCLKSFSDNSTTLFQDSTCGIILGLQQVSTNSFSLSPNPASTVLYIKSPQINISRLSINDISGKKLVVQEVQNKQNANINIAELACGIYLLVLEDENGNQTVKKFLKE